MNNATYPSDAGEVVKDALKDVVKDDVAADFKLVLRYSRRWIHYGLIAHTVICTFVAAIEGLFYRLGG